jgi:hypothetical protein
MENRWDDMTAHEKADKLKDWISAINGNLAALAERIGENVDALKKLETALRTLERQRSA